MRAERMAGRTTALPSPSTKLPPVTVRARGAGSAARAVAAQQTRAAAARIIFGCFPALDWSDLVWTLSEDSNDLPGASKCLHTDTTFTTESWRYCTLVNLLEVFFM